MITIREEIDGLLRIEEMLGKCDPITTLLINIDPTRSGFLAQYLIHRLSTDGKPLDMIVVETPKEGQPERGFELNFMLSFCNSATKYSKFILVANDDIYFNNIEFIKECMKSDFNINEEQIISVSMISTKREADIYIYDVPFKFWWE